MNIIQVSHGTQQIFGIKMNNCRAITCNVQEQRHFGFILRVVSIYMSSILTWVLLDRWEIPYTWDGLVSLNHMTMKLLTPYLLFLLSDQQLIKFAECLYKATDFHIELYIQIVFFKYTILMNPKVEKTRKMEPDSHEWNTEPVTH